MIYTQVSDWTYTHKPTDPQEKEEISGGKHFSYKNMSEQYFLEKLQEGHGFCPLHRSKEQADKEQTNIIVFDFDYNTLPINEFVTSLPIKPTFTYYSYSTGKWNLYRYRLIYQLFTPIRGYQYDAVLQHIVATNQWKKTPPHKKDEPPTPEMINTYDGLAKNQYFFSGTHIEYHPNNVIDYTPTTTKPKGSTTTANGTHPPRQRQATNTTDTTYFPTEFVTNISRLTPHAYTQLYADSSVYYSTHTPLPEVDDDTPIIQYPKDYIETPRRFYWDKENRTHFVKKWEDGQARHRKIYMAGIIIRKLNPQLTPTELLFAAAQEFATYYDNSDSKYYMATLLHIVECVLNANVTKELGKWKRKNYIVNGEYCDKYCVAKIKVVGQQNGKRNTANRVMRYEEIAKYYDPQLTDNANLLRLKQKGIKCGKRTLTSFKQEYGYTTTAKPNRGAAPQPSPKPKEKHHTPTPPHTQQPMGINYLFDGAEGYKQVTSEELKLFYSN